MNAKQIKNQVLTDLTEIQSMCIAEIGGFAEFNGDSEEFIWQNRKGLPENWQLKHEQLEINFPSSMVPALLKKVKSEFPSGIAPKSNGIGTGAQTRSKNLQKYIHELRVKYQAKTDYPEGYTMAIGKKWFSGAELNKKILAEKARIKKEAEKNGIVRDCWAYISDPRELEGVHYAWVNPVVKFEALCPI